MPRTFFLTSLLLASAPAIAAPGKPDFNRDVRPILSQSCFKCHGMDDKARKAKLRFDVRESALTVITPGQPDKSEFIKRIVSHDPDELMPPPAAKRPMTEAQKKILRDWVASGAEYAPHWAFAAPKPPTTPNPLSKGAKVRNAIDNFVIARLEIAGLTPSPEADKYTLARRVSLDLIGLPPTPAEADAFVNDKSPDAYEKLVDRLLASPQYGERWARRWLDLARYADTNGYEKDRNRTIWPYRDWVVRALNDNMPFDQFSVKQLAGDMLPNATPDDFVATGFHRNTMLNEEGGIDPLEFRFNAITDRVATTGTVWMGLTTGCAQCHTHKFDPIQHKEYFGLMAFLNNADEPDYEIADAALQSRRAEAKARVEKLIEELPSKWPVTGQTTWQTPAAKAIAQSGVPVETLPDGALKFGGTAPEADVYTLTFETPGGADRLKLEVLKDGAAGPGRTPHGNFVLSEITISAAPRDAPAKAQPVKIARAEADFSQDKYEISDAIDGDDKTGWAIDGPPKPQNRTAIFSFDKPAGFAQGTLWTVKIAQNYGMQHVIGKLRLGLGEQTAQGNRPAEIVRAETIEKRFAEWEKAESAKAARWQILRPSEMKSTTPFLNQQPDGSILAGGDISKSDVYSLKFNATQKKIAALRIEAIPDPSLPGGGPGLVYYEGAKGDFFLSEFQIFVGDERIKVKRATQTTGNAMQTQDGEMSSGWSVGGAQTQTHAAVFEFERPVDLNGTFNLKMLFERHFACPLGRFRVSVSETPGVEARQSDIAEELHAKPAAQRSQAENAALRLRFFESAPEMASAIAELNRARAVPRGQSTLAMRERPASNPRTTFLHHRGEYLLAEAEVKPGIPAFLPPLKNDVQKNRLGFSRWLFAPENPLTARVTVNRQWQAFFGRGLVRTMEDFGYQGETPSHPELLDYLAVNFQKNWDVKALHELIVMSATYRQSSRVKPELIERDPQNVLLSRGPRFRLEAEIIRDAALKSSGLLSAKMGGPGVYPPQPDGVFDVVWGGGKWNASNGEDRYRRSLYTYMKRTAPFAMFNTFDGPVGDTCLARREVSNTPLQALVLLNDVMFQETAQALGKSAVAETKTPAERAAFIFRRALTRPPDADELAKLVAFAGKLKERGADEQSVWMSVSRAVLNLDEAVTKS